MNRIVIILIVVSMGILKGYSAINISSCQGINDSILDSSRTVFVNESFTNVSIIGNCIEITTNNLILDCNNNQIRGGNSGKGVYASGIDNITIVNCNINNFSDDIYTTGFSSLINISNNSLGGVELVETTNSFIQNNVIGDLTLSLSATSGNLVENNVMDTFFLNGVSSSNILNNNTIESFGSLSASNQYIVNNTITVAALTFNSDNNIFYKNSIESVSLTEFSGNDPENNNFTENIFTNFSLITSSSWSLTPTIFNNNSYFEGTVPTPPCFDFPTNSICDSNYQNYTLDELVLLNQASSSFSTYGFLSLFLMVFGISIFLRF